MQAGREFDRKWHLLRRNIRLLNRLIINSTDNLLNTLILHAINRGAITRCFLFVCLGWNMHAHMVFHVLGFSLAAILYLILVRGCSTTAPFLSCLNLMTFSSSSRSPMICTCKHDPALFSLGVLTGIHAVPACLPSCRWASACRFQLWLSYDMLRKKHYRLCHLGAVYASSSSINDPLTKAWRFHTPTDSTLAPPCVRT